MKFIIGCAISLIATSSFSAEFKVNSSISSVMITPNGGFVTRRIPVDLPKGSHQITILGLPKNIDLSELSFKSPSNADITLISSQILEDRFSPEFKEKSDEVLKQEKIVDQALTNYHLHQEKTTSQNALMKSAELQLKFINSVADGSSDILQLEQLGNPNVISNLSQEIGEQFAEAIIQLQTAKRILETLKPESIYLLKKLENAQKSLASIQPLKTDTAQIILDVFVNESLKEDLSLSYLHFPLSWRPVTELRLVQKNETGNLSIIRRAIIQQNTGEDWSEVMLSLSTVNLQRNTSAPLPSSDIKNLYDPNKASHNTASMMLELEKSETTSPSDMKHQDQFDSKTIHKNPKFSAVKIKNGQSISFQISKPITLKSGVSTTTILLDQIDMPVNFYARAQAKETGTAYLYTDIINTTGGMMLESYASIYRDGVYFGQTYMPEIVAGDSFELALGQLDGVLIEQKILKKEAGNKGLLSSHEFDTHRFETEIKSLLDYDIELKLFDTLPVSESEDLVIKEYSKPEPSKRDIQGRRGVLQWDINLAAGSQQIVKFGYDLRWPSGKEVLSGTR